jgi:two-component system, NtrC family, sensor kinase
MIMYVRTFFISAIMVGILGSSSAQPSIDSLQEQLVSSKRDTNRVLILSSLSIIFLQSDINAALQYAQQGMSLARELNFKSGEADCLRRIGIIHFIQGRYPEALDHFQKALNISQSINHSFGIGAGLGHIGNIYAEQGDQETARSYYSRYLEIARSSQNKTEQANALKRLGQSYLEENLIDSASLAFDQAYKLLDSIDDKRIGSGLLKDMGDVLQKKGNNGQALYFYHQAVIQAKEASSRNVLNEIYVALGRVYLQLDQRDSSVYYGLAALDAGQKNNYAKGMLAATRLLADAYEAVDATQSLRYSKMATALKDSLFNTEKATQVQNLFFLEHQRKQDLATEQAKHKNQLRLYALFGALTVFILLAFFLYRNNRSKQKANVLLGKQKQEIQEQRGNAEKALQELKATQAQLIQAEKMASLGELTAGIAHEIQNPLNFINNFSDLNGELVGELKEELNVGRIAEAMAIATGIGENEQKINHHGKRADSIVKGMLQHSRNSSGQKELTDINKLVDECMRLTYHGMRAKDKSFNAKIETELGDDLAPINIVPQDIGRVLLNLFTNAFYSVNQKHNEQPGHKPLVSVKTTGTDAGITITVKDNGWGVPQKVMDKIFQPFFTTKPAGEGTGLGLSLSYDIVTKGHSGELRVESEDKVHATFIIYLPYKS